MSRYLPNLLSALRLLAAPCAAWLVLRGHDTGALIVFVLAGFSDLADGFLARRWGFTSRFGGFLDPAADKLLMILCFVALYRVGAAPFWLPALVICRDCSIVAGVMLAKLFSLPVRVEPLAIGKAATTVQIGTIGIWLLLLAFDLDAPSLTMAAAWTTAIFTVLSWLAYGQVLLRALVYGSRTA